MVWVDTFFAQTMDILLMDFLVTQQIIHNLQLGKAISMKGEKLTPFHASIVPEVEMLPYLMVINALLRYERNDV